MNNLAALQHFCTSPSPSPSPSTLPSPSQLTSQSVAAQVMHRTQRGLPSNKATNQETTPKNNRAQLKLSLSADFPCNVLYIHYINTIYHIVAYRKNIAYFEYSLVFDVQPKISTVNLGHTFINSKKNLSKLSKHTHKLHIVYSTIYHL